MSNRFLAILLAGAMLAALLFMVGAGVEERSARYAIAATSAETPGGYILEVFVVDPKTGVVKHVVSDKKNQLGRSFQEMKVSLSPDEM